MLVNMLLVMLIIPYLLEIMFYLCCYSDNPETDIYGANLYDRYLQKRARTKSTMLKQKYAQQSGDIGVGSEIEEDTDSDDDELANPSQDNEMDGNYATSCRSILVCTGVYCSSRDYVTYDSSRPSNHNHRDFVLDPELKQPKHVTQNVFDAVKFVFGKEGLL